MISIYFSRPRTVDEVAYQDEVVAVLKKSLQGADVSMDLKCIFSRAVVKRLTDR